MSKTIKMEEKINNLLDKLKAELKEHLEVKEDYEMDIEGEVCWGHERDVLQGQIDVLLQLLRD